MQVSVYSHTWSANVAHKLQGCRIRTTIIVCTPCTFDLDHQFEDMWTLSLLLVAVTVCAGGVHAPTHAPHAAARAPLVVTGLAAGVTAAGSAGR